MEGVINEFAEELVRRGASRHTIDAYRRDIRQFRAFLAAAHPGEGEGSVTPEGLRRYAAHLETRGYSERTVRRKLAALRSFVRYLEQRGILESGGLHNLSLGQGQRSLPAYLHVGEMEAVVRAPGGRNPLALRDRAILALLYSPGLRLGQLASLNTTDVDVKRGTIRLREEGRPQVLPLSREVRHALQVYLDIARPRLVSGRAQWERALFLNRWGSRLTERGIRALVLKYVEEAWQGHLVRGGADLQAARELLGQAGDATMQIYKRAKRERLRAIYKQAHPRA